MPEFRKILFFICIWVAGIVPFFVNGQQSTACWVFLKPEFRTTCSASPALSPRSLARRMQQGISLDESDYPVCTESVEAIQGTGVTIRRVSRWFHAVSVEATPEQMQALSRLPQVQSLRRLTKYASCEPVEIVTGEAAKTHYDPGYATNQIEMLGLDVLHANGYNGAGMLIAMMDDGYYNANHNPGMAHIFNSGRVLATWDFQDNETDVFDDGSHGAYCFSLIGGYIEGSFVGSAPGASFILARTEVDAFEHNVEEDNWVAAAEWADSIGADLFSTSLGYSTFDSGQVSYLTSDMDGNTTIITRAADLAASKGILVVNAAGNEGANGWHIITAPSDGDSVLAVGAVDSMRTRAGFSSVGPTADSRIKPDLMAMGAGNTFIYVDGSLGFGSGTSFACPMMAGLAACVWQSKPILSSMQVFAQLKQSADRYANPDYFYGYGIPNGIAAFHNIHGYYPSASPKSLLLNESGIGMYPNPSNDQLNLVFNNEAARKQVLIRASDLSGKKVFESSLNTIPFYNVVSFSRSEQFKGFAPGTYMISVYDEISGEKLFAAPFILTN